MAASPYGVCSHITRAGFSKFGDSEKPIVVTELGWPTHNANVDGLPLLRMLLKAARPDQSVWRCVYAATTTTGNEVIAEAIVSALPPGSTCEALHGDALRERLDAGGIYRCEWTRPDGTSAGVLWKPGATERREVLFSVESAHAPKDGTIRFRDHTGRTMKPVRTADGAYLIPVGESPVFFEGGVLDSLLLSELTGCVWLCFLTAIKACISSFLEVARGV